MNNDVLLKILIFSSIVIPSFSIHAQIEVRIKDDTIHYKNPIEFTIINNDSLNYHCFVQLEKQPSDFEYELYSEDVFSKHGVKSGLPIYLDSGKNLSLSFFMPQPTVFVYEKGIIRDLNKQEIIREKQGTFRLKIKYCKNGDVKYKILYSTPFVVGNKRLHNKYRR